MRLERARGEIEQHFERVGLGAKTKMGDVSEAVCNEASLLADLVKRAHTYGFALAWMQTKLDLLGAGVPPEKLESLGLREGGKIVVMKEERRTGIGIMVLGLGDFDGII